jgi:uncharacterized protein (DUF58 family)
MAWVDVPGEGSSSARLAFVPARRGLHDIPTLVAQTSFPLGLFKAWTVWRPAGQLLAYPAPEQPAHGLPHDEAAPGGQAQAQVRSGGEFDGVRAYRRGDTVRQVVWKKAAKNGELVSRDTSAHASRELWLDFQQVGLPDAESRLSRLAAWVMSAEQRGLSFGLRLPGQELPCGQGEVQRRAALEALALWGGPAPQASTS